MAIINAHHTSFSVLDMQESLAFYRDLLGFEVVNERPAVKDEYFREIVGFPDAVVYAVLLQIPGTEHMLELLEYIHPRGEPKTSAQTIPAAVISPISSTTCRRWFQVSSKPVLNSFRILSPWTPDRIAAAGRFT